LDELVEDIREEDISPPTFWGGKVKVKDTRAVAARKTVFY